MFMILVSQTVVLFLLIGIFVVVVSVLQRKKTKDEKIEGQTIEQKKKTKQMVTSHCKFLINTH